MAKYQKPIQVSIPTSHDLGFCTVNQTTQFPFTIFNPNLKPIHYNFKFTKFIVVPSKGVLMPNSISNFRIEFNLNEATVIVGTVVLQFEGEEPRVYKLSAVGKYPYISLSDNDIQFGDVLVTKAVSRQLVLKNNSEVPARFTVVTEEEEQVFKDNFFSFEPDRGLIPPKMTFQIKLNYTPQFTDVKTINKFSLICQNGNKSNILCKAYSKKMNVNFNSNSINFGEIKLQSISSKVLTIINSSELQSKFQFYTDSNNIFSFSQTKGVVPKNSYKKIIIEFRPRNTISYYERVYCIVRNHLLLYVDLIGTCYDLLIKPIPLLQQHIDIFRKRVIQGRISEVQLKYIQNNLLLKLSKRMQGNQQTHQGEENFYAQLSSIIEDPYVLHKQLFLEGAKNELITISEDNIEFGFCEVLTSSGQRQIEIVNKLNTKLSLFWIPQKRQSLNGQFMTVFNVFPDNATLKPNTPVKFQLTFRPLKSNNYYFQYFQFYAVKTNSKISKRTLEDFQTKQLKAKPQTTLLRNIKMSQTVQSKVKQDIESTQVFPPLSGVVRCVGHSFASSSLPFLPIMKINPSKNVTFKPCYRNYSVYETVELTNQSDTPIYFKFGQDINRVFRVYPRIGLIEPKSFRIVTLEFSPKEYKTYQTSLSIYLNDMNSAMPKLNLVGICSQPYLKLQNNGQIFFPPTSVGVYTKKSYNIENKTKNKINYKIEIPTKYKDEIHFQPLERLLEPNQSFNVDSYFTPLSKRSYKIKVPIIAYQTLPTEDLEVGYHKPGSAKKQTQNYEVNSNQFLIEVIGEGSDGSIQISQDQINFNVVKISQNKKLTFQLKNSSNCAFYVQLLLKNDNFQSTEQPNQAQINGAFQLDFKEGIIPANSQIKVGVTFSPIQVLKFHLKLLVNARERAPTKISTMSLKGIDPISKSEVKIKAQGNFPLLEIIDIRNDTLSVAALWENFQISKINSQLCCNLNSAEKQYLNLEHLTFNQTKNLQSKLKNFEWNLGYVSTKTKARPRKVIMTVRNIGGTPLVYTFRFPSDNKIEEQLWADPGQPSPQEAYQKAIIDKKIFQINPKTCLLQPNQIKQIELLYSPTTIDIHKTTQSSNEMHFLKVVFQINNGKSLVFNLKGTTLGPNQGLVTVKKTHYNLPQIPIGLLTPLRFPIEMNNVGSIKVTYKTQIIYQNNQFPQVFKIQNPNHFILPGENLYLYCLYKPFIRKTYQFKIIINMYDFNKQTQSIELNIEGHPIGYVAKLQKNIIKPIGQRTSVSQLGTKVFFSIEQIDFGVMDECSTKYRMIILYNMSKDTCLNYDFPTQNMANNSKLGLTCGDKFIIEPSNGALDPQSFIELKISLTSNKHPSIYFGEIPCNITWANARYSSLENDNTQKDTALLSPKQTLFLRIKKSSSFEVKQIVKTREKTFKTINGDKKSVIDIIFDNIICNVLNDPQLLDDISKLQQERQTILDFIDPQQPVSISNLRRAVSDNYVEQKRDYSNHENLFLNDEFKDITELIMENTFFNIIQQTTHVENDFLRVAKKFIQADKV